MFIFPADIAFLSFSLLFVCFFVCFVLKCFNDGINFILQRSRVFLHPVLAREGLTLLMIHIQSLNTRKIYQFHKNVQGKEVDLNRKVKTHSCVQREKRKKLRKK